MSARLSSLFVLALLAACSCPDLRESYATPQETLATFQAQLCREDQEGEYACFSEGFKRGIGGFENYYAAREMILDKAPLGASTLLERVNLDNYISSQTISPDGLQAELVMARGDDAVSIFFVRETLAMLEFEDGSRTGAIQDTPLAQLVGSESGRNWVLFDAPFLSEERLRGLTNFRVSSRWHISGLTGFTPGASGPQL